MAATSPSTALTFAKRFVKGTPVDHADVEVRILDDAAKMFHAVGLWSWALTAADVFTLDNSNQDYVLKLAASDLTDFSKLAYVVRTDGTADSKMDLVAALPINTALKGQPSKISSFVSGAETKVRVFPFPAYGTGTADSLLVLYKTVPTNVTSSNKDNADVLDFPEEYYYIYDALVLYFAYLYIGDQRAGNAIVDGKGSQQYTGQLGTAMQYIAELRQREAPLLDNLAGPVELL